MHHLHLHRLQPFLSSPFLLPSCPNFNCYPCPRRGPLPKPFSLPITLSIHLNSLRYVYRDFLISFPCGSTCPGSSSSFFLFGPMRKWQHASRFHHFLPTSSACAHGHALCDLLYVQSTSLGRIRGTRLPCQLSIWQFGLYKGYEQVARLGFDGFGSGLLLITSFSSGYPSPLQYTL